MTAADIKKSLLQKALELSETDEVRVLPSVDPNDYILKFTGIDEYISNESLAIYLLFFLSFSFFFFFFFILLNFLF